MRLYNTLTRQKDELPPPPGPIRMYFCGPTVYARAHVGNARPFILGMWLRSWLRATGYDVTLVHNITDINDKIYEEARKAGTSSAELAQHATQWYLDDTRDLGLGEPDEWPKATEMVPQIVSAIEDLIERGYAYPVEGDVYYRVARFPDYGRLSGQRPDQVEDQEPNDLKEDARDFALWKANKPDEDTWWDSPWGHGRPGWHIECSVMAEQLLGPAFEVHGGGIDLVFPHHENEIAQSRALGHEFAQLWAHNGLLRPVSDDKMSKSLGNFVTLRDGIDRWGKETLLVYFLTGHWRKPIDYSDEDLERAAARVETFRNAFLAEQRSAPDGEWERFSDALDDDFNTPEALAVLHDWASKGYLDLLARGLEIFGLSLRGKVTHFGQVHFRGTITIRVAGDVTPPKDVVELVERREEAREKRDFEAADQLRDQIDSAGWTVRDEGESLLLARK